MEQRLIIVDNFFDNPEEVRRFALNDCAWEEKASQGTYPGVNTIAKYWDQPTMEKFSLLIGKPIHWPDHVGNGVFRSSSGKCSFEQDIHHDPIDWSAIIYLNPDEQCQGRKGTTFWKHKENSWESYHDAWNDPIYKGLNDDDRYKKIRKEITYGDGLDRSKWHEEVSVPLKFNRAVIFHSYLWHSHAENFGESLEDSRLIQAFFFYEGAQPCSM